MLTDRDSSVGIATRYRLDGPGIEFRRGRDFPHPSSRPWCPPSLLYNGYRLFPGVRRPGRGVDHQPQSNAEVKERVELYLYSRSGPSWSVLWLCLTAPPFHILSAACRSQTGQICENSNSKVQSLSSWTSMFGVQTFLHNPFKILLFPPSWLVPTNRDEALLASQLNLFPAIAQITLSSVKLSFLRRLLPITTHSVTVQSHTKHYNIINQATRHH